VYDLLHCVSERSDCSESHLAIFATWDQIKLLQFNVSNANISAIKTAYQYPKKHETSSKRQTAALSAKHTQKFRLKLLPDQK
jgi:hypothetical protein